MTADAPECASIPRALDHIGLVVPDANQAIAFFEGALSATLVYRHGPYPVGGPGRDPSTTIRTIAMLRFGTLTIEVLEYNSPDQGQSMPRLGDLASVHLAFYTDDIEGTIQRMQALGARSLLPVRDLVGPDSGPGAQMAYVLSPWGLPLELITYPHGRAYEAKTSVRLFDPRTVDDPRTMERGTTS
ncbi:VOC family protein [Rhodococcus koreensis]